MPVVSGCVWLCSYLVPFIDGSARYRAYVCVQTFRLVSVLSCFQLFFFFCLVCSRRSLAFAEEACTGTRAWYVLPFVLLLVPHQWNSADVGAVVFFFSPSNVYPLRVSRKGLDWVVTSPATPTSTPAPVPVPLRILFGHSCDIEHLPILVVLLTSLLIPLSLPPSLPPPVPSLPPSLCLAGGGPPSPTFSLVVTRTRRRSRVSSRARE